MRRLVTIRVLLGLLLLAGFCVAQDEQPSLGDIARQERARKAAEKAAAGPELGAPPPVAMQGEIIPAQFLRFEGDVAGSEYLVVINGVVVIRNTRVPGLPLYVTPFLRDGANLLGLQFISHADKPLDVIVEERYPGDAQRRTLVHYHANANQFPQTVQQEMPFTAHPKLLPDAQLTSDDRSAIQKLIRTFYDALSNKNGAGVLKLFEPAIEDARGIYPEGAEFGQSEMTNLAHVIEMPGFEMKSYDPEGLTMAASGNIVAVKRTGGTAVFMSTEVTGDMDGSVGMSRISANVIPVKKIKGVWRLTLPFGF
jgi:hypothetical protein